MAKSVALVGRFKGVYSLLTSVIDRVEYELECFDDIDTFQKNFESGQVQSIVIFFDLQGTSPSSISYLSDLCLNNSQFCSIILHSEKPAYDKDCIESSVDYEFEQPITEERLHRLLLRAARLSVTRRKIERLKNDKETGKQGIDAFLGRSKAAKNTRALLQKVANVPITSVMLVGETGTGKGLVARILHSQDQHQDGDMIEVNCAAIPRDLLESELFGHEAGSFTGANKLHRGYLEQANDGTLFLDEITEMDLDLQSKLLKAVEEKKFRRVGGSKEIRIDVSIIAASNRDLSQAVKEGKLREDLFHRLAVVCIDLPPLRSRKEDLLDLVPSIVAEFNTKANKRVTTIEDEIWEKLSAHDWPGNIRELRNVIERCVLFSEGEVFPERWLMLDQFCSSPDKTEDSTGASGDKPNLNIEDITANNTKKINDIVNTSSNSVPVVEFPLDGNMSLEELEKKVITTGLRHQSGNVTETARLLGVSREKLRYRLKKYSITT